VVQLVCEFLKDVLGCGGRGLVLDNGLVDCLDMRGVIGGEDGDV
jgi:hypothetical protein